MVKKKQSKKFVKAKIKSSHKSKKPNPKIFESYDDKKRAEWNKERRKFEEIAEELSRDSDFIGLYNNILREKWVKQNYPRQKDAKALVRRAMDLYRIRIKKFSI